MFVSIQGTLAHVRSQLDAHEVQYQSNPGYISAADDEGHGFSFSQGGNTLSCTFVTEETVEELSYNGSTCPDELDDFIKRVVAWAYVVGLARSHCGTKAKS